MDILKVFLFIFTVFIFFISYIKNKDLFSPVKVYLAYSFVFYAGIYFSDVRWETLICYLFLISIIFLCIFFEPRFNRSYIKRKVKNINDYILPIWLVTIPGIAVMSYLLISAGGIDNYFYQLSFRVKDWAGIGYLTIWFTMIPSLNLLYFSLILLDEKLTKIKIFFFLIHFVLFICIGLLTASRSFIATNILGMIFVYSYLVRLVRVKYILSVVLFILLFSGIMGTVRNDFGNKKIDFDDISQKFESSHFKYGIIPLELIFSSKIHDLQYGKSYLSVLTNFIPRRLYPDKPDTGGIIFTKIYTGDKYQGLSNLATGSITEGIVNFGLVGGVFSGIAFTLISFIFGCFFYKKLLFILAQGNNKEGIRVILYFYVIIAISRLTYSEFTDVIYSILFSVIVPFWLVSIFKRVSIGVRKNDSYNY